MAQGLYLILCNSLDGLPYGSAVKNCLPMKETRVQSSGRKDPLEKEVATHSSILAGEFRGQRSLVGYSPWVGKVGHSLVIK